MSQGERKNSMFDGSNIDNKTLNNTFINKMQKLENLPETSLRVKGDTHSKLNILKKVEMAESIDDILDNVLTSYINKFPLEKQEEIKKLVNQENDYKIKKARKKASNRK